MHAAIYAASLEHPSPAHVAGRQAGAALLTAMLIVSLVATLAAGALWRQWRQFEVERAQRTYQQGTWLLLGVHDWARVMLREDARANPMDHLEESWAQPRHVPQLSTPAGTADHGDESADDIELALRITDLQSRLNVNNLVDEVVVSEEVVRAFHKLFRLLALPDSELETLVGNLQRSRRGGDGAAPLAPQRLEQLVWLGLSRQTLEVLRPHIALLPERTPLNLNTAGPEVIYASIPELEMEQARRVVRARTKSPFDSPDQAMRAAGLAAIPVDAISMSISTRYFEVHGHLRSKQVLQQERWLMQRDNDEVTTLAHERLRP